MPEQQFALEGHKRSADFTRTITSPAVESTTIDLGAPYEEVVIVLTSAQAANLASSNVGLIVEDEEWIDPADSAPLAIAKPAAGAGIYFVAKVGYARNVKITVSVTPTSPTTFTVRGLKRLTKSTADEIYNRTLA